MCEDPDRTFIASYTELGEEVELGLEVEILVCAGRVVLVHRHLHKGLNQQRGGVGGHDTACTEASTREQEESTRE